MGSSLPIARMLRPLLQADVEELVAACVTVGIPPRGRPPLLFQGIVGDQLQLEQNLPQHRKLQAGSASPLCPALSPWAV